MSHFQSRDSQGNLRRCDEKHKFWEPCNYNVVVPKSSEPMTRMSKENKDGANSQEVSCADDAIPYTTQTVGDPLHPVFHRNSDVDSASSVAPEILESATQDHVEALEIPSGTSSYALAKDINSNFERDVMSYKWAVFGQLHNPRRDHV